MRVRRADIRDVVFHGGRAAVYVDEQVVVLSEIATVILNAVPHLGAVSLDRLASSLLDAFGPPPPPGDAVELTRKQVLDLVAHGVLADDNPTVASAPTRLSTAALRDALRHIRTNNESAWRLPPGVDGEDFLASALQHHVLPFVARHAQRLDLPRDLESALSVALTRTEVAIQVLVDDLDRAVAALDESGVRVVVIKGLALATQAYGDEAVRGPGDLDLLVAPDDLEKAYRVLTNAGWHRDVRFPEPGSAWAWGHLLRTGYELTLVSDISTIDLHWHLTPMRSTSPTFEELWQRREVLNVRGLSVPTLGRYDALAHSASHSAKDQWRWLRSLLDVHVLAADVRTWQPSRPLRHEQLVTLGLAAHAFGSPSGAPEIVAHASHLAVPYVERVSALHTGTERTHVIEAPGTDLGRSLRGAWRTRALGAEVPRMMSRSLLPPWLTADEPSRHAAVAVSRVFVARAATMVERVRDQRAQRRGFPTD